MKSAKNTETGETKRLCRMKIILRNARITICPAIILANNRIHHTTWKLLQSEAAHVRLLSWHQHVQDVRTRVALSQQLLDELEEALERLTRYRPDLLPDSLFALCERKPFRCRSRGGGALEQRLRYATQTEMAGDRFLLAYLSRFQPCHLLPELVKDFRGPTITPGLQHATTLPMVRVGQQKLRGITQGGRVMDHDQTLTSVAFEAHYFRKDPELLALTIATPYRHRAETFGVLPPEDRGDGIDPLPLPTPLDMPRAFHCTDPMFAHPLEEAGQVER